MEIIGTVLNFALENQEPESIYYIEQQGVWWSPWKQFEEEMEAEADYRVKGRKESKEMIHTVLARSSAIKRRKEDQLQSGIQLVEVF